MARLLEEVENVSAVEVGLEPEGDLSAAQDMLYQAGGVLPVIAALPFDAPHAWFAMACRAAVSALTLSAPRGTLPCPGGRLSGRLYGPSLLPLVLPAVVAACRLGLPVIAGSGAWSRSSVQALLDAGASAVQLDGILWKISAEW
jgi:hypothetical protein